MSSKLPRTANAPFDVSDADVIFRTSDDVDFRLYRVILSMASPVFKDMLSLPQPPSSSSAAAAVPVIPVSESSSALEPALLFCYPAPTPIINTLTDARLILEVAIKYDMDSVMQSVSRQITSPRFIEENPLAIYCIACRYGWEQLARSAATSCLQIHALGRPTVWAPELELITAAAHHRLLDYHLQCGRAAGAVGHRILEWVADHELPPPCSLCNNQVIAGAGGNPANAHRIPKWFVDVLAAVSAILAETPGDTSVIHSKQFESLPGKSDRCASCSVYVGQGKLHAVKDAFARKVQEEIGKVALVFK